MQALSRPDEHAHEGRRWRDLLLAYNAQPSDNPLGLMPACRLYRPETYDQLVTRFGESRVFILSAGWRLIRADFLTPAYDITFSAQVDAYNRRRSRDAYDDFCMLEDARPFREGGVRCMVSHSIACSPPRR